MYENPMLNTIVKFRNQGALIFSARFKTEHEKAQLNFETHPRLSETYCPLAAAAMTFRVKVIYAAGMKININLFSFSDCLVEGGMHQTAGAHHTGLFTSAAPLPLQHLQQVETASEHCVTTAGYPH